MDHPAQVGVGVAEAVVGARAVVAQVRHTLRHMIVRTARTHRRLRTNLR